MNELMTPLVDRYSVLSTITLALLQDSGWYRVNYSAVGNSFQWGRSASCSFVLQDCGQSWTNVITISYDHFHENSILNYTHNHNHNHKGTVSKSHSLIFLFIFEFKKGLLFCCYNIQNPQFGCREPMALGCTFDYRNRGYCNLMRYPQPLEPAYRHFSDPTLGGSDSIADYCPYVSSWSDGDCTDPTYPQEPEQQSIVINQVLFLFLVFLFSSCSKSFIVKLMTFDSNVDIFRYSQTVWRKSCFEQSMFCHQRKSRSKCETSRVRWRLFFNSLCSIFATGCHSQQYRYFFPKKSLL